MDYDKVARECIAYCARLHSLSLSPPRDVVQNKKAGDVNARASSSGKGVHRYCCCNNVLRSYQRGVIVMKNGPLLVPATTRPVTRHNFSKDFVHVVTYEVSAF